MTTKHQASGSGAQLSLPAWATRAMYTYNTNPGLINTNTSNPSTMKYWPLYWYKYSCSGKPELLLFHIMCKLCAACCLTCSIAAWSTWYKRYLALYLQFCVPSLWYGRTKCVMCNMQCCLCFYQPALRVVPCRDTVDGSLRLAATLPTPASSLLCFYHASIPYFKPC